MMKQLLAIDIGNTNITLGLFNGKALIRKTKMPTGGYQIYEKRVRRFIRDIAINSVVVSSVVPKALRHLKHRLMRIVNCKIAIVGKDAEVPIKNLYKVKSEVGQDRLVNAFAAKILYGAPAVVIDFGTAITFDIVSRRGEYLGGLILPGIGISLSSLHEKTALLPKVELRQARHIIGKNTVNSMRGGILFGFGAMCDGLVLKYRELLGKDAKVIATGGNAHLIRKYANVIQRVDEDLTLKGLSLLNLIHPPSV